MFSRICFIIIVVLATPAAFSAPLHGPEVFSAAYPGWFNAQDNTLAWPDQTTIVFDDGRTDKSFQDKLDAPDLEDTLSQAYPAGKTLTPHRKDYDPGRFRSMAFLKKMYGGTEEAVRQKLVTIQWMPKSSTATLEVTTVNGVHKRLQAIAEELEALPLSIKECALKPSESFCWRPIAGTDRLSPHSFGIAIDLDLKWSQYWRWDLFGDKKKMAFDNHIPMEVVEIFERHGFIWGGKWYHYDTMHFEYRPELLGITPEPI